MHATCLHCTRPLGSNDVLETLPVGRRIAFDASQGRLWVVCRQCAKWNLVPFDTRLETIDAAERLFRDTRTRYSTDNIGLARLPEGLELVRIGPALRPEFAAWRYGESYRRRRRNTMLTGSAGVVIAGGIAVASSTVLFGLVGLGTFGVYGVFDAAWRFATRRNAHFTASDPDRKGRVLRFSHGHLRDARLSWLEERLALQVPRPLSITDTNQAARWSGLDVATIGRRVLGGLNLLVGSRAHLTKATALLEQERGDLHQWLRTRAGVQPGLVAGRVRTGSSEGASPKVQLRLNDLAPDERLCIEMWMNEDIERTWLEGELKLLEREWREAEQLAKIADELALAPGGADGETESRAQPQ